jgi:TorA maturation chaperone TorD
LGPPFCCVSGLLVLRTLRLLFGVASSAKFEANQGSAGRARASAGRVRLVMDDGREDERTGKEPDRKEAQMADNPKQQLERTTEILDDAAVAFGLTGRLFWEDPEKDLVEDLSQARRLLLEQPFPRIAPEGSAALHSSLESYACADEDARESLMQDFRTDRAYLFYQVGYSRTSPYESVYRTPDRTMFGPTTAQVKAEFERYGLALDTGHHEPADHFALECMFISKVAQAGLDAAGQGDGQAALGAASEIKAFLSSHLLVFSPVYLVNFSKRAHDEFYRAAAELARETLAWGQDAFGAQAVEKLNAEDFPLSVRMAGHEG